MSHNRFFPLLLLLAFALTFGACSSSDELNTDGTQAQGEEEFQRVDREESIIPETDEPVDIEVVEDEPAPVEEAVPVRTEPAVPSRQETPAEEEPAETPAESVSAPSVAPRSGAMMWSVQLGAFKNESGAFQLVQEVKKKFNQPVYKRYDAATGYYKVTLGSFQTREEATNFKADVQSHGYPDAFTVEGAR